MPVEFLSDDHVSAYDRFPSEFTRAELERYFFLDDVDRALIEPKRVITTGSVSPCSW